jgi:hypothetical protein
LVHQSLAQDVLLHHSGMAVGVESVSIKVKWAKMRLGWLHAGWVKLNLVKLKYATILGRERVSFTSALFFNSEK